MKLFIASAVLLSTMTAFSAEVLQNCFSDSKGQFVASDLTSLESNESVIMLLNKSREVVGYMSVTAKDEHGKGKVFVTMNKISLCSSLETDSFYYNDEDVLGWAGNKVEVTQDEGKLVMDISLEKKASYANLMKVNFKAYDVFTEPENIEKQKGKPDFEEDWGLPKGKGTFYFYLPTKWEIKK